ncbi:hypothetical protein HYZ64_03215 [Candidatus Berkelbacteria bacterium]|nr:hypothetical protein [Candidatus Berkelbacteria bacterium]
MKAIEKAGNLDMEMIVWCFAANERGELDAAVAFWGVPLNDDQKSRLALGIKLLTHYFPEPGSEPTMTDKVLNNSEE